MREKKINMYRPKKENVIKLEKFLEKLKESDALKNIIDEKGNKE